MSCTTERGGVCVITAAGEFDVDTAQAMREILDEIAHSTAQKTIIDCTRITTADPALLHVLLDADRAHHMILAGPLPHQVDALLTHTATATPFLIADSVEAARSL
ncbi:STAS domain-containing protein [Streptomyces sp. NPDC058646]|uniref:STAS domain-containing protein n=1 Tax=Streptomyces sp. NPDC058646 TaxID=3346574 RepID=UPI0036508302